MPKSLRIEQKTSSSSINSTKQCSANLLVDQVVLEVLFLPAERQSGEVNPFYEVFDDLITQN